MRVCAVHCSREPPEARDALESLKDKTVRGSGRELDMLEYAHDRDGEYFTVMRTDTQGAQSLQRINEPFSIHGTIVSADAARVTQDIGRGETFTYKTEELLRAAPDPDGVLRLLEHAAATHELTSIELGSRGLDVSSQSIEQGRGYEHGR